MNSPKEIAEHMVTIHRGVDNALWFNREHWMAHRYNNNKERMELCDRVREELLKIKKEKRDESRLQFDRRG